LLLEGFIVSLLSWLFPKKSAAAPAVDAADTQRLSPTQSSGSAVDPLAELKQQRHDNRENLYETVRSVMLRSEVLSSHYKFKVLSLDARGRQFLVMVDLLNDTALPPHRWAAVEQLMANTAAQHHDLQVKAVYWRMMMAQTEPAPDVQAHRQASTSAAAPVAAAAAAQASTPIAPSLHGYEPINQDEVLAFKKAIAGATAESAQTARAPASSPQRAVPEHGYEDTQIMEPDPAAAPLSKTQFGGLD